ncbi:MAG: glutamate--tRNA ligase, partial [Clostridia bacterium]|nr:glutamate--tRNA ligase [Clostridia bacterium]
EKFERETVKEALSLFLDGYDISDEQNVWFDKIKAVADKIGFASDMKEYKKNPDAYKGSVADVSMFIRIAVTGKTVSPDMYEVMRVLGRDKVAERINNEISRLSV